MHDSTRNFTQPVAAEGQFKEIWLPQLQLLNRRSGEASTIGRAIGQRNENRIGTFYDDNVWAERAESLPNQKTDGNCRKYRALNAL